MSVCVVTATDRNYFAATEVMLRSLDASYHGKEKLDVFVFVTEKLKDWEFVTKYENLNIKIWNDPRFNSDEFRDLARSIYTEVDRITPASMYRFFIAEICGKSYEKALYIDPDCVIAKDIEPLLNYDLGKNSLAAFQEVQLEFNKNPTFKDTAYFNSGVMLVNISYWRTFNISKKLMEKAATFSDWTGAKDQDILNAVLAGTWLPLPMSYNYLINIYVNIQLKSPLIVHWAGKAKPWLSNCPETEWKKLWKTYRQQGPTTI